MRLVEAIGLEKDWDGTPLFEGADFSIEEGEKVGLVGANGSGKSSLLGILAGRDPDYRGSLRLKAGLRVGYAAQRFEPEPGLCCADLLAAPALELEARLESKGEELGRLEGRELERGLAAYGELRARYEAFGAEEARERASRLLERLGLPGAGGREAARLSGGEKNVLSLAAALMGDPELLILDEPGNHLDFGGLAWLESFVSGERRAVLLVSHNRWLLDRSVGSILELEGGRITRHSGGFSAYRVEKLKAAAGRGRDYEADRKRIERLEALVRRFADIAASRPDPAWGKRLRARRSQLEREREAAARRPELGGGRMSLSFAGAPESKADFALIVQGYRKGYGSGAEERLLLEGASLDLLVGERAALVGPNGSGKTSLLRDIVAASGEAERKSADGSIKVGPSMRLGYSSQEGEVFDPARRVGEEFRSLGALDAEAERFLRRFLFPQGILERRVGELSGGELKRLEIARASYLGANFLVLDEPTNHLDIEGREALEEALADFGGTLLLVSHDRWFLEKTASRLILLEGKKLLPYEGSFAEYWRDRGAAARPAVGGRKLEDRASDLARGRKAGGGGKPIERRIEEAEARKQRLEAEAAAALGRGDYGAASRLAAEAEAAGRLAERLYEEWAALG